MKNFFVILLSVVLFAYAQNQTIDLSLLEKSNGVYLTPKDKIPYNGKFTYTGRNIIGGPTWTQTGTLKNGKFHGECRGFRENGRLQTIQNYKDGVLNGEEIQFYDDGITRKAVVNFLDGKQHGRREFYSSDGKLTELHTFKNGGSDGESRKMIEGKLHIGYYKDGEKDGVWEIFNNKEVWEISNTGNEKIIERTEYKDGKKNGKSEIFYENGNVKQMTIYVDDKKNGKGETFYESGKPGEIGNYKDDKLDGKYERFYEDGKVAITTNYKDGKLDGKYEQFFADGTPEIIGNYPDGKYEAFYQGGKLKLVGYNKDGKRDGKWEEFDSNGNLTQSGNFVDGRKDGVWFETSIYGETRQMRYKNGAELYYNDDDD